MNIANTAGSIVLASNGNVGIGTMSPGSTLDVVGSIIGTGIIRGRHTTPTSLPVTLPGGGGIVSYQFKLPSSGVWHNVMSLPVGIIMGRVGMLDNTTNAGFVCASNGSNLSFMIGGNSLGAGEGAGVRANGGFLQFQSTINTGGYGVDCSITVFQSLAINQ